MGKIIIHRGDSSLNLDLFGDLISIIRAEHRHDLNSIDQINLGIESENPLEFNINDFIIHEDRKFRLNNVPKTLKEGKHRFSYDLIFESSQYDLIRKKYFNSDAGGFQNTLDFPVTGPIETHLQMLIVNANREKLATDSTWILGSYPAGSETKTFSHSNENCLQILQKIVSEDGYSTEFQIDEDLINNINTLNVKTIGQLLPFTFSHGQGNGLYKLERNLLNTSLVTRLFVYGATENLPSGYRDFSDRLRIPEIYGNYIQDLALLNEFGLIEGAEYFDDIKPSFEGTIFSVDPTLTSTGQTIIEVPSMDFDLKEKKANNIDSKYLIPNTPAKISVKEGNLAGYEFEIGDYDKNTKKFKINPFTDSRGDIFPSKEPGSIFVFAPGDKFTLFDIIMPESYIVDAEEKLLLKGQEAYEKLSKDNIKYNLDIDPLYLESIGPETQNFIKVGDSLNLIDDQLGIDKISRVISLTRDLLNLYKYSIDLSDSYEVNILTTILSNINTVQTQVKGLTVKNKEALSQGYKRMDILKDLIFDPDGYLDPGNIKPESIETGMISIGARSQQLNLDGVIFNPNYQSDRNSIQITNGKLNHFSIDPTQIKTWDLLESTILDLSDSKNYYIYAKVPRSGTVGTYLITEDKIKYDATIADYHFLIAVLYQPLDGMRFIELMYGATYIHGRELKTGRISSVDGLTWFDLDTGEIKGRIEFSEDSPALSQIKSGGENLIYPINNYFDFIDDIDRYFDKSLKYVFSIDVKNTFNIPQATIYLIGKKNGIYSILSEKVINLDQSVPDITERFFISSQFIINHFERLFCKVIGPNNEDFTTSKPKLETGSNPSDYSLSQFYITERISEIEQKANWFTTTISGNVITTGTLLLGNYESGSNGGITGEGNSDDVFLWAGTNFENRDVAPIRFYRNGSGVLKNVTVEGTIIASEGRLGGVDGWYIDNKKLINNGQGNIVFGDVSSGGLLNKGIMLGYDVINSPNINCNLWIRNTELGASNTNIGASIEASSAFANSALVLSASGGTSNNALVIDDGNIFVKGSLGFTGSKVIGGVTLNFKNGILIV